MEVTDVRILIRDRLRTAFAAKNQRTPRKRRIRDKVDSLLCFQLTPHNNRQPSCRLIFSPQPILLLNRVRSPASVVREPVAVGKRTLLTTARVGWRGPLPQRLVPTPK